jgi:hypothetical protein
MHKTAHNIALSAIGEKCLTKQFYQILSKEYIYRITTT